MTPNIAICFFGLTRSLSITIDSIKKHIFKILKSNNLDFDIYLSTYNLEYLNNPRSNEINIKLDLNEFKLLEANYIYIDDQDKFDRNININDYLKNGDPWKEKEHISLMNLIRQLNTLKNMDLLFRKINKKYKCYIFIRPDLEFINDIDLVNIKYILDNYNENIILTPINQKWKGLNDRFYITTHCATSKIINRLDELLLYSQNYQPHSESFLLYIVNKYNTLIINIKFYFIRVRANGIKLYKDLHDVDKEDLIKYLNIPVDFDYKKYIENKYDLKKELNHSKILVHYKYIGSKKIN